MEISDIDIRSFLGTLRRQARLIVATFVTAMLIAGVVVFALTPIYSSSTLILIDPRQKNLLTAESDMGSSGADSARIDSEVEILRSDNVLLRVIRENNLITDPEFGVSLSLRNSILAFMRLAEPSLPTGEQALNQSLNKLRAAVTAQRRGITYLISLTVRSEVPGKAADLANALAQAYIADQVTAKVDSALASRDILQNRIIEARDAIARSESSFDDFVQTNLDNIVQDTGRTDIANLQQQIEQLSSMRQETLNLTGVVQRNLDQGNFQSITESLQSEALAELERQRRELQASIESAAQDSPAAVNLRERLAAIEENLRSETASEMDALRESVASYQQQEEQARQTLRTTVLSSSLSADTLTRLFEFQQNAELARQQYQTLLSRVQDLDAQANLQIADSRIVSPALVPGAPSFPNTILILAMAAAAALGLGVTLALLYENVIGGFTSEAQMEAVLKRRVAAAIPRERKGDDTSLADMMTLAPLSVYAESVRRLRAALEQGMSRRPNSKEGVLVMVCSTAPAEGKTTMALSLARSYALSGRNTLLIDCDLRKPSIHRQLGLEPNQGLLEFLADFDTNISPQSIIAPDPQTGAMVVLGARRSGLPTDQLIAGAGFQRLISASRKTFDVIVVDTPPIGPVVDASYIAKYADAIVYVVKYGSTSQADAREGIRNLSLATNEHVNILTVLNQQDVTRSSYRQKYGDYYSEYTTS